ncbi:putative cytochrome P450 110 [Hyella patelloides LEGE 07179]|uniref:Putative cytochrome P450 110 n=1 Tax=Hyella patelloides LEGE 07179 TaxID=945734 RepID=A0A563VTU7_9CYAN|nr:cytochrome P450 [Hyella patelloides]VEP14833.1 putative cytochrome P450 110 [Hyella patelloides LEGE 07179]
MALEIPQVKQHTFFQRIQWIADPVGYMENAVQDNPDLFAAEVLGFGNSIVFVNHPEAIKELLSKDRQRFPALGSKNGILRPLVGDNSIFLLSDDRHQKRRKLLLPPFHGERMHTYGKLIRDLTLNIFNQLSPGETFTARTLTQDVSLKVILEAVYGLDKGGRSQKLRELMTQIADAFNSPLTSSLLFFRWLQQDWGAWSPWGKFLRQQQELDEAIYQEIASRRANQEPKRQDILSLLMSATDEAGNPLTNQELRDELMTLMFAGHETTATSMAWAMYWIHHLPEVKRKLIAEIASLGDNPDPMAIMKLPYLNAICQETFRIYPVAMLTFPRVAQNSDELFGYKVKPGQVFLGCIYLTHQREDIYPEPKKFKPERFLDKQFSPYEFVTFGGGSRRCIGEALAQFEMKMAIATILSNYDLTLANNFPEKPARRGVTLAPGTGVKMIFKGIAIRG